ncbi:hypothetical protein GCM10023314_18620 [Algibacter agarivorans]|uniref:6-phosphogluconolactonase n=1 Tax=Algibacter agarivorans TaxID=1109741 RepID=A0ABP9GJH5_9FLAO
MKMGQLNMMKDYQSDKQKKQIYRAADIHISPDGNFLYATNHGPEDDSILIFSIIQETG